MAITIDHVRRAMQRELPGVVAQLHMAPAPRPLVPPAGLRPRQAGVLLLLYPGPDGSLLLVLTLRAATLLHHQGQISFPGGGREPGDASLEESALREAREELGSDLAGVEVLGALTPLYVPPSDNCVNPYVAHVPFRPQFRPDPVEVAELLEVPLDLFLDPQTRREEDWTWRDLPLHVPFYAVGPHKVWGATAIILSEFVALLLTGGA